MSEIINATGFNDPAIQVIRSQVATRDDAIPFLLLPVKIETRFMKADREIVERDMFPALVEKLFEADDYMHFDPAPLPSHEVLGKIRKIQDQFKEIARVTGNVARLSGKEKDHLRSKLIRIEKTHDELSRNLSKIQWNDGGKMKDMRALKNKMANHIYVAKNGISGIKPSNVTVYSKTSDFLETLAEMNDALHKISRRNLKIRDRKEKRLAFEYLDSQITKIYRASRTSREYMSINLQATRSQLKRFEELKKEMDGLQVQVKKNIVTIASGYKKAEYSEKLLHATGRVRSMHEEIDWRVMPKIEMKNSLKTADAREVIWQIQEIRYYLKRLNRHPFRTLDEIQKTRQSLYRKLQSLTVSAHKIVEGDEGEIKALSRAWDDTDKELEKFTVRIRNFKGSGGQKAGLSKTINHINTEYRKDLSGLKSASKSYFPVLNNSYLEKSAISFSKALRSLREIREEITSHGEKSASRDVSNTLKKLIDFQPAFSAMCRDLHILPGNALKEFTEISAKLESEVGRIIPRTKKSNQGKNVRLLERNAAEAASKIHAAAKEQFADDMGRKTLFNTKERSPMAFARRTVTRDELWVRFYPDDIAIHTHEEALTSEEIDAGKAYWYEIWAANDDYESKLSAWRAISTAYGPQRAAWIVRELEPPASNAVIIRNKLLAFSKKTLEVNENLAKINSKLTGIPENSNSITLLGQIYPLLKLAETGMNNIEGDHISLLRKTQKLLLRIQSQFNALIRDIRKTASESGSITEAEKEVVNQAVFAFNRTARSFEKIKKKTSKEIIKNVTDDDVFPDVAMKEGSWTQVPHSKVMPDRFVVLTMSQNGEFRHLVAGKPLPPERLIVGINPETFDTETFQYDADGNLIVDDNIKWLTDFDTAVENGMAVTITLDEEDLSEGFKKVFVIGVKNTTALEGKELLEALIENHHYIPEGASFLPVNTPTNNTESGTSGYRSFEEDASLSFFVERNNEEPADTTIDPDYPTDGERFAVGLGIDPVFLNNLDYSNRTEISDALNLNKALYPGTIGNYIEEGLDTLFTKDNLDHTKTFMGNYVTARGFLPAIRIGTQPYGILATTAFSQFHATNDDGFMPVLNKEDFENQADIRDELQIRYDIRFKQLMNALDGLWTAIRNEKVLFAGNTNPENPQAHFMEMLGLQANSVELFYRYGLNIASRQAAATEGGFSLSFNSSDAWSPAKVADTFRDIVFSGYFFKSDHFADEHNDYPTPTDQLNAKFSRISDQFSKARVFGTRHLKNQSRILGDIVDNRQLADEVVSPANPNAGTAEDQLKAGAELQNYIDWLVSQNPWDIHAENKYSELSEDQITPGMPSKSLLFLLLRHSLLTAYADAILKILEHEGLTDQETRKKMGQPAYYYNRFAEGFHYVTKWTFLFSKINRLNNVLGFEMETSNPYYIYMNSLSSGSNGYLNRYVSPENTSVFNNYAHHSDHQQFIDELAITRNAIVKLKNVPSLRLQQLLIEHFDLCTYRLDAWRSGMVNKRLTKQRLSNPSGIYLGAYGWVEDLRKGGARVPAENIPDGLWKNGDDPIYTDADSQGFIHSPSLNHAITAAILRAGFTANSGTAEIENQMAVNLSSERVRSALNLINGMRNGQDAGALLGYQFERGLHERYLHLALELDEFIYDFRTEFPLSEPVDENVNLGEAVLTSVVNGIDLLETAQDFIDSKGGPPNPGDNLYQSLKAHESEWWNHIGNANLKNAKPAEKDAMLREIDRIADSFDSMGDLCISESVYQVTQGNHVRASAIMDKLAKGDVPSDIEISDTPRSGTVVTQKVALFFEVIGGIDHKLTQFGNHSTPVEGNQLNNAVLASGAKSPGWNSKFTPRAIAEPTLNKWIGGMIGNPAKIRCLVSYEFGEIMSGVTISLADLEIQPLDALHLFGTGPLDGGSELNARIAMKVKAGLTVPPDFQGTADDAVITIKYTFHDPSWAENEYSFYEKAGYFQSLRKLLTDSAPLAADSLILPGEEQATENEVRNEDVNDFLIRITNLNKRLELVRDDLGSFFADEVSPDDTAGHVFTELQIDRMRELLFKFSLFGIPGTIPDPLLKYGNDAGLILIAGCDGTYKAAQSRLKQASADMEIAGDETRLNNVRIKAMQEAGRKLLGKAFVMLPHFSPRNTQDITTQLLLDAGKGLLRASPGGAFDNWSGTISRVRERMSLLDTVQMWAENFNQPLPDKKVIQFPFALDENGIATDHWLGLQFPDGYTPDGDKLSIVLINPENVTDAPDLPKAALLVDEWIEIIPNLNETTGIAFNYDQPDAKPPNSILLAVTPRETGSWKWDDLVHTLNDTLEMAKNRAVEPEHLENTVFGQILPAILTEIVPPQLLPEDADDSSDAQDNPLGLQVVTDFGVVNETFEPENEE